MHPINSVDEDALVEFTKRLIRTPSLSGQEEAVASLIRKEMKTVGFNQVLEDEVHNVLGLVEGSGPGPTLLFLAHSDHAEVGGMDDPFAAKEIAGHHFDSEGRVIHGRGACDMKGALAAMVYAVDAVKRSHVPLNGRVLVLAFTREEEGKGEGLEYAVNHWDLAADMAISGEATNLEVHIGHRGSMQFKITARGRSCHSSDPSRGINAIDQMNKVLTELQSSYTMPVDPALGEATFTVLDIRAEPGSRTPVVPDLCEIILDRRYFPNETREAIETELWELIGRARETEPGLEAGVELHKDSRPYVCDPEEEVVQLLRESRQAVLAGSSELGFWKFGIDIFAVEDRGIPCAGLGPGQEAYAHTPQDHVAVSDLVAAAQIYATAIRGLCGS